MQSFAQIHAAAARQAGGADVLEALLPPVTSTAALSRLADDRCLAEMTRCVFRAGFVWRVVDDRWAGFEAAFDRFDPAACAALSDTALGNLRGNAAIVRNFAKICTVRGNARFVLAVAARHGSFGRFLADWPADDTIGLWRTLIENGKRLGGMTGPLFLAAVGRDTFLLRPDVVRALGMQGVVARMPATRSEFEAVQVAFHRWRAESGRALSHISRVLALSQSEHAGSSVQARSTHRV